MVFSSVLFLFLYLPVVLGLYFVASSLAGLGGRRYRIKTGNLVLLASSVLFYAWGEQWLVFVMLSSTVIDYCCGLTISGGWKSRGKPIEIVDPEQKRTGIQRAALITSIVANLSILGFFKYFNFGVDNVNAMAEALGAEWLVWRDVMRVTLPLGISFYTFQSLSYTIDVYRGQTRATRNFLDFSCFVTLFPQLVAGPIVRYKDIATQLYDRVVTREGFAEGVRRFIIGLGKKVIIANTVAATADEIFGIPTGQLTPGLAWLGILCYTLQIYFDFSGYSDMAIGLGRMFGFRFLENFQWPYIAQSIKEFWRRWHISLSTWFRDYLYIPLGGNRGSVTRNYFNLVTVFFLCGLWHGASWSFVVWGLFHGAFLVIERVGLERVLERCYRPVRHVYTLLVVMIGWVLFRAETLSQAGAYLAAMAGFAGGDGIEHNVPLLVDGELVRILPIGVLFSIPWIPWLQGLREERLASRAGWGPRTADGFLSISSTVVLMGIFLICSMWLSSGTYNPFIYFRF